jgi:hypothetical protein
MRFLQRGKNRFEPLLTANQVARFCKARPGYAWLAGMLQAPGFHRYVVYLCQRHAQLLPVRLRFVFVARSHRLDFSSGQHKVLLTILDAFNCPG